MEVEVTGQIKGLSFIPREIVELSWVYLTADGQSTSSSWYRAHLWGPWPDFILILSLVAIACSASCRTPSLTRGRVCNLQCNHWGPITIHYRLIWDCVPSSSPFMTRRDYGGAILTRLHTRSREIAPPPQYPFYSRLGGSQSQSAGCEVIRKMLPLSRMQPHPPTFFPCKC
jgi:hypothetical protein